GPGQPDHDRSHSRRYGAPADGQDARQDPGDGGSLTRASKSAKSPSPLDPLSRSAVMSVQPLFTPLRMGDLDLPNRIVMAPLTRMRAGSMNHEPTALQAEYYAQRGSAGLIVAEATAISADGFGYADTPGLWSADQVRGWRVVTDAVHATGGRIIAQLWHTGAIAHPDLRGCSQALSASDVDLLHESVTASGRKPTVAPRPMTIAQVHQTAADYAR